MVTLAAATLALAAMRMAASPVHVLFLMRGPNQARMTEEQAKQLQAGHIGHLTKLGTRGDAYAAGPFEEGEEFRGIVIVKAPTLSEAIALEAGDPAVVASRLKIVGFTWNIDPSTFRKYQEPMDMETFTFVRLDKTDPARTAETTPRALADTWRKAGKLIATGDIPTANSTEIMIFVPEPSADTEARLADHPAVKSGQVRPRILKWWVAKGIFAPPKG